jgi:hypothetical protein
MAKNKKNPKQNKPPKQTKKPKSMRKCSPSLATKEMHIKTTLRFHPSCVRTVIIQNTNKCCRRCRKKGPLYTFGGNVISSTIKGSKYGSSSKK